MVSKQWVKDLFTEHCKFHNEEMSENNCGHNLTNRRVDEIESKVDALFEYFDLCLIEQPKQKIVNRVKREGVNDRNITN